MWSMHEYFSYWETAFVDADKCSTGGSAQEYLAGGLKGLCKPNLALPVCMNPILIFHLINLLFLLLQGLIVSSRKDSLQHFKKPWAHEHEPVRNLVDAVNVWFFLSFCSLHHTHSRSFNVLKWSMLSSQKIKPTVLIGTSGQGRTFTKEVIEAMASINKVLFQPILST